MQRAAFSAAVPGLRLRSSWPLRCSCTSTSAGAACRTRSELARASASRGGVSLASKWVGTLPQPLRRPWFGHSEARLSSLRYAVPGIMACARRSSSDRARARADEPIDAAYGEPDLEALDDEMESPKAAQGAGPGDVQALAFASAFHAPVMWRECVESLVTEEVLEEGGVLVDCTLGGGGHTSALLAALFEARRPTLLVSIDQDFRALGPPAPAEEADPESEEANEEEGEGDDWGELDEEGRPAGARGGPIEHVPVRHRVELRGRHALHAWQSVHANFRDLHAVVRAAWEAEAEARGGEALPPAGPRCGGC
eukprot:tig00001537_g9295.t1